MLNLPNFLTLIRILTIPFFLVSLAYHRYSVALLIFIFGAVTDFLDGLAARWMHQETRLGAYLDPVADKLLVFSSYVMLGFIEAIPLWLVMIVVMRDVLIIIGFAVIYYLVDEKFEASPTVIGKCSTLLQLLTLAFALTSLYAPSWLPPLVLKTLVAATATVTMLSGIHYLYRGFLWLQRRTPFSPSN
ncbi:MAG: CDP-alcohol phosphatidyltransferase family protein [Deltaproteobacteria bacterium]|nr:CDP-alcohol phosphatidyltransferase family protein [Deltaproteobacteria bacterium]